MKSVNISKYIRVFYTNADCLMNKIDELRFVVNEELKNVSLVAVTEVNSKHIINKLEESEFYLNGFNLYSINFNLQHFRGIFCYVKNSLNISSVNLSTCFNEYLCLNVNGLLILVIYRSPHSDSKNNQNLLSLLKEFLSIKGSKVICGDFNLPNINWSQMYTTASNKSFDDIFLQFILDNYLFQCVSKPTRSRNQQKMNILDLVLTPSDELINNLIHKAPLGKSDHCILCFDCNLSCPELLLDNSVGKYNFSKGNYLGMNEYINKHLSVIIDIGDDYDVNRLWETFVYVVKTAAEIFIPRYKKKCNSKFGKGSNWGKTNLDIKLSNDVYDLIKKKNKLWSRYIKTKNVEWLNKF